MRMWCLRDHRHRLGHGPHERDQCSGHGDHTLSGMFPAGHQWSRACTEPHLRHPAEILDGFGGLFQVSLSLPTDVGRVAPGPRAFDESPSSMAIAGLGEAPLTAPLPRQVFCRGEAERAHALRGVVKTGEVPEFGHGRDGHRQLHTPQGLERLDHWGQAPHVRLGVEFLLEALEAGIPAWCSTISSTTT
jgi:hypothetical protein